MVTKPKNKMSKKQIVAELWKRGDLTYKFNPAQNKMHKAFQDDPRIIVPILASRRTGKTFYLLLLAFMTCIKKNRAVVKFLQPTQKELKKTIRQIMPTILEDCPEALKPEWKENDKIYLFPNGSEIQLAGSDGKQYENLRGGAADLCIVDEAGFCDELEDAVFSVLEPTTATTDGRLFLASTPSKLPTHDFMRIFIEPALQEDNLLIFTIHDNTMISEERKERIKLNYPGGEKNPKYRREYLCEIIRDEDTVVIPEFNENAKSMIVSSHKKPPYCDYYVSADLGFKDLTVFLFAYYDFREATLVIEDELIVNGPSMTTGPLAAKIREYESRLFRDDFGVQITPYLRVADNNNQTLLQDLTIEHGLYIKPTAKDNKDAQIDTLRTMIQHRKLRIHPRCKHVIYHLQAASWDKNRKKFLHLPNIDNDTVKGGHADALDALIYMVRNIVPTHNPFPSDYGRGGDDVFNRDVKKEVDEALLNSIKQILNIT
jgi:PBSX family phage terminase large subunit